MASDGLNQIGKYIGKTGKDADRALKRAYPIQPKLERVRDVFDETIPFEMTFYTERNDERVLLDLFFNLPPPIRGCKLGCVFSKCEAFSFPSGGDHYVTVAHPYVIGSVSVFVNNARLDDSQVNESSPDSGELFFQGTGGPDDVVICYVYTECPEDEQFVECPALTSSIGGLLIFSDRFDKTPSTETWGGLGFWHAGGLFPFTPIAVPTFAGATDSSSSYQYEFFDFHHAGVVSEVLLAINLSSDNASFSYSNTAGSFSLNGSTKLITMSKGFRFKSSAASDWGGSVVQKSFLPTALAASGFGDFYIRFVSSKNETKLKMWPMLEAEPDETSWVVLDTPLPNLFLIEEFYFATFRGGSISGRLYAIQHWQADEGEFGVWDSSRADDGNSWLKTTSHGPGPFNADGVYFRLTDSVDAVTEFTAGSDIYTVVPTQEHLYTSDFFNDNSPLKRGSNQTVVSFSSVDGKIPVARIEGQVRWRINDIYQVYPPFRIFLMPFVYGIDVQPPQAGQFFSTQPGAILSINAANAGEDWVGEWTDFVLDIPAVAITRLQWGARFELDAIEMQEFLGKTPNGITPGSLLRNTEMVIEFRNFWVSATTAPVGPARPICPSGGPLLGRCTPLIDNFVGTAIDYTCDMGIGSGLVTNTLRATTGQTWTVTRQFGPARIELNNSVKVLYQARGITTDGSDGRCPYRGSLHRNGLTSATDTFVTLEADQSPADCGQASVSFKVKIGPLENAWEDTNGQGFNPSSSIEISAGDVGVAGIAFIWSRSVPSLNYIQGTNSGAMTPTTQISNPVVPGVFYSARMELTNTTFRFKIWREGDPEPSAWGMEGQRENISVSHGLSMRLINSNYTRDDFYIEIKDLAVESIEPVVV